MKEVNTILKFMDQSNYISPGEWFSAMGYLMMIICEKSPTGRDFEYCETIKKALFLCIIEQLSPISYNNDQQIRNCIPNRFLEKEISACYLFPPHR